MTISDSPLLSQTTPTPGLCRKDHLQVLNTTDQKVGQSEISDSQANSTTMISVNASTICIRTGDTSLYNNHMSGACQCLHFISNCEAICPACLDGCWKLFHLIARLCWACLEGCWKLFHLSEKQRKLQLPRILRSLNKE